MKAKKKSANIFGTNAKFITRFTKNVVVYELCIFFRESSLHNISGYGVKRRLYYSNVKVRHTFISTFNGCVISNDQMQELPLTSCNYEST
jgi:hypothetical protein